jgi:hypothetical protein
MFCWWTQQSHENRVHVSWNESIHGLLSVGLPPWLSKSLCLSVTFNKLSHATIMFCHIPRIGTLLEMVRTCAIRLAEQNLRVRVCVQGSMGVGVFTGLPKQLSGVATILQRMVNKVCVDGRKELSSLTRLKRSSTSQIFIWVVPATFRSCGRWRSSKLLT